MVIAGAAVLRIVFLVLTWNDPVFRVPYLDGAFYHAWARSLAMGMGDFQGPYFLGPLYPHFLSWWYRIASPDPAVARIVQSGLGVVATGLVYSLGTKSFGMRAGLFAALCFALHGPVLFYENLLLQETLWMVLGLTAAWVAVVPERRSVARAALAGACIGAASLGRATALGWLPIVWMAMTTQRTLRWRLLLASSVACAAVLAPVVARNASQGARAITTNGGVNFFAGNGPGATGRFREPPGIAFFRNPVFTSAEVPPAVAARALRVEAIAGTASAADSRAWMARTWESLSPLRFMELIARRVWLASQAREIAQVESYAYHSRRLFILRLLFMDFGWLWPLALLGLWSGWHTARARTLQVAGFAVAALLTCFLFFVTTRYRLAAVPFAAVLAGHGFASLIDRMRARRGAKIALALALVVATGITTRLGARPPRGAEGWDAAQMAERLYALGDLAGAIRYQERAAEVVPERFEVRLNLALYLSERDAPGDLARAVGLLREAVRVAPERAILHFNLGSLLEQQGDLAAARRSWAEALRLDPGFEPARSRLLAVPGDN
jgi:tetratricopeptide (TPR) repeat protein